MRPRGFGHAPNGAIQPPRKEPHDLSTSEWTDAVSCALPYLDANDVRRALCLFDHAMINLQKAKHVKVLLDACTKDNAQNAPNPFEAMLCSLHQERQLLLQEFRQLLDKKLADACGLQANLTEVPQMTKRMPFRTIECEHQVHCGGGRVKPSAKLTVASPGEQGAGLVHLPQEGTVTRHRPQFEPSPEKDFLPLDAVSTSGTDTKYHHCDGQAPNTLTSKFDANKQISTILDMLSSLDSNQIITVRRIGPLGYKTERVLKSYFEQYGGVVRVFIAHSSSRHRNAPRSEARCRQGSLGFIHMDSAMAVEQILAVGVEHKVSNVLIRVQRFHHHAHAKRKDSCESDV